MRYAAKARKEIGIRSIFNMLGPLTNPAGANCQLLGVYAPELTEMFAQALRLLGAKRAFIVHGHDGLDEISVCAPTRISELKDDLIRTYDIMPEQFFGKIADPEDMLGGDSQKNAGITSKILEGEKGPRRDVVVLNASSALVAAGKANDFKEGISLAETSIDSGAAAEKLEKPARYTQENG
jgi:anthranilate phosphoribosyltransferase